MTAPRHPSDGHPSDGHNSAGRDSAGRDSAGRDIDYLAHLAVESARFGSVLDATAPRAQVPTCPGWNADDLLWHLSEVQWFWRTIVRDRVDVAAAKQMMPPRPAHRPGLMEFYLNANRELETALRLVPPDTPVWTWAEEKTAGFVRRRQAHEALIHRIDAELTAGTRSGMDPALSADGVDEALRVMYGGEIPAWGTFTGDASKTVRILAADTGASWFVTIGRFSGTDPEDQKSYDEASIKAADSDPGTETAATISGTAADLDCLLWHRPTAQPVERTGSEAVLADFDSVVSEGIN